MVTSVKAPGLSWSWWTALSSHVSKHFSTNAASFTHSIETHDIEILPILMDKGQLLLTYATRWEPISFPANYCLIIHQAACRWIFSASSMKSELQCGAGLWKDLSQLWSECLVLSVCPACSASLCMLCWVGNPAHRVIAQWDKQGRVSGLLMWEHPMFLFPGMKAVRPQNKTLEENTRKNLKIQEN